MPVSEDGDPDAQVDQHFSLDVVRHLRSDWAQAWYHFAVFMTKGV